MSAFHSTKKLRFEFRKFHVPSGTVDSGCTDPTQATARLIIVLVRRIQKSGTGDNSFVQCKGTKVIPNIPVRQNWNGSFHLISNRNFRNFGLNGKRPIFPSITAILTLYKLTLFVSFVIIIISLHVLHASYRLRSQISESGRFSTQVFISGTANTRSI